MFDGFAIHIQQVEGAVGCMYEIDGAKPVVGGGDEFAVLIDAL